MLQDKTCHLKPQEGSLKLGRGAAPRLWSRSPIPDLEIPATPSPHHVEKEQRLKASSSEPLAPWLQGQLGASSTRRL